jgi:hypothetical protein
MITHKHAVIKIFVFWLKRSHRGSIFVQNKYNVKVEAVKKLRLRDREIEVEKMRKGVKYEGV